MSPLKAFLVMFLLGSVTATPLLLYVSSAPLAMFLLGAFLGPPKVTASRYVRGTNVYVTVTAVGLGIVELKERIGDSRVEAIRLFVVGRITRSLSYAVEGPTVVGPLTATALSLAGSTSRSVVLGETAIYPRQRDLRLGVSDYLEFDHVRQYVPGDHLRDVNWKATAKTGMLMVNVRRSSRGTLMVYADPALWEKAKSIMGALRMLGVPAELSAGRPKGLGVPAVYVVDVAARDVEARVPASSGHVIVDVVSGTGVLNSALEAALRRPRYRALEERGARVVSMFPMDSPTRVALAIMRCLNW